MGFSSRPLVIISVKVCVALHISPLATAVFPSRTVVLTSAARVVFAVLPRVFPEWDTLMRPVSLRDVVALGVEIVASRLAWSGFAILTTLLLQGKPSKELLVIFFFFF